MLAIQWGPCAPQGSAESLGASAERRDARACQHLRWLWVTLTIGKLTQISTLCHKSVLLDVIFHGTLQIAFVFRIYPVTGFWTQKIGPFFQPVKQTFRTASHNRPEERE